MKRRAVIPKANPSAARPARGLFPVLAGATLLLLFFSAEFSAGHRTARDPARPVAAPALVPTRRPLDRPRPANAEARARLEAIRARADAAFARRAGTVAKATTSIGRPSPADSLPSLLRPPGARLRADARVEGGRLWVVDLPAAPDAVRDTYVERLRGAGFRLENGAGGSVDARPLVARDDTRRLNLTFHRRETGTRVEIARLDAAAG